MMITFCKAMNTWIFTFLVFGLSFSVWGKTNPSGERNSLKILSYNINSLKFFLSAISPSDYSFVSGVRTDMYFFEVS